MLTSRCKILAASSIDRIFLVDQFGGELVMIIWKTKMEESNNNDVESNSNF